MTVSMLVVTDVDSTLIQDEVIELLADAAGVRADVAAVTERAMRGEIEFRESLTERVATLGGLPESVVMDVVGRVRVSPGAEQLISAVHAHDGSIGAVSGGFSQILEPLADRLGLDLWAANVLEIVDGRLTGRVSGEIVDGRRKADLLTQWAAELQVPLARTVAIGDGANDLVMMRTAGTSIGYRPKPVVAAQADHVLLPPAGLDSAVPYLPIGD
ncbi:MAG: phosphoserine phosphatase SerB [Pseudoclavibacter sp.]